MPYGPTTLLWVNLFILNLILGLWIFVFVLLFPLLKLIEMEDEI